MDQEEHEQHLKIASDMVSKAKFILPLLLLISLTVNSKNLDSPCTAATNDLSFSPNGKLLASVNTENQIMIWEFETGQLKSKIKSQTSYMSELDWTPDGEHIVSASRGGELELININTGNSIWKVGDFNKASYRIDGGLGQVEVSPSGKYVATLQTFPVSILVLYEIQSGSKLMEISLDEQTDVFVWGSDDKTVYTADVNGFINEMDLNQKSITSSFQVSNSRLIDLDFKEDKILCGGKSGQLILLDLISGKVIQKYSHNSFINRVAFLPKNNLAASVGGTGFLKIWSIQTDKLIISTKAHIDISYYVSSHPDEEFLATSGEDNCIRIWNIHELGSFNTIK